MPPLRQWLLQQCLPFWAETARDGEYGGFVRLLDSSGRPVVAAPKATLVQARLMYSFAHGRMLGAGAWALEAADEAFGFLVRHMWDEEGGGFRHTVGLRPRCGRGPGCGA